VLPLYRSSEGLLISTGDVFHAASTCANGLRSCDRVVGHGNQYRAPLILIGDIRRKRSQRHPLGAPTDAACRANHNSPFLRNPIMRILAFAFCLAATAAPAFAGTVYQVDLANSSPSGIVSIETARSGSERFRPLRFVSQPLRYGSESVSFQLRGGDDGCVRDLRITFADGHVLTHRRFDPCAVHSDESLRDERRVVGAEVSD
jgi:hypothetical protein